MFVFGCVFVCCAHRNFVCRRSCYGWQQLRRLGGARKELFLCVFACKWERFVLVCGPTVPRLELVTEVKSINGHYITLH